MKTILLKIFLTSTFSFLIITAYAQSNYRPGFVISLQNDTIYGQIDFRTDKMNAKRCVFKPEGNSGIVTYYPYDIQGYRFTDDGKYYISYTIELKHDEVPQPVFLEYLLQGIKSLYYYETENYESIYFVGSGDKLIKVDAPKIITKREDGSQYTGNVKRYIPILQYAFGDCPALEHKIKRASFTHKGLIDIAKDYHYAMCTSNEDCIEFETKEDKHSLRLYVTPYAGIQQYSFPSSGPWHNFSKPDLSYLFGVNLALNSRRWMSSLSASMDISISHFNSVEQRSYQTYKMVDGSISETYLHHYTRSSSLTSLSAKLGIRYTYPKGRIRPFIEAGGAFAGMIGRKFGPEQEGDYSSIAENVAEDTALGYYVNTGLQIKPVKRRDQYIVLRAQFEAAHHAGLGLPLYNAWSGAIGYTF